MEKDEKILNQRYGRQAPFVVPDGYFENFTSELMTKLPDHRTTVIGQLHADGISNRHRTQWQRWTAVAASVCAVVFGATMYLQQSKTQVTNVASANNEEMVNSTYTDVDAMTDYAMLDSDDLYAYMTESY